MLEPGVNRRGQYEGIHPENLCNGPFCVNYEDLTVFRRTI